MQRLQLLNAAIRYTSAKVTYVMYHVTAPNLNNA